MLQQRWWHALTNAHTVRKWNRGISRLKLKHSSGTSVTARAPWVREERGPAHSDAEESRDINKGSFWNVTSWSMLSALDSESRGWLTSSAMICGWSSPLTIRVRYLARYSSCRAVERWPSAKQYRARWVWTREHICLMRLDGFIEISSVCGSTKTHVVLYSLRMVKSLQALAAHYSFLLVGQSLGDTGEFKNQKSVRIHWFSVIWSSEKPPKVDPRMNLHLGIPPWGSWVVPGDAGTCKRPRAGSHILWQTEPEPGWSIHNHLSEALNKYKTLQIINVQKSSMWYCLLYESRQINFPYADHSSVQPA